MDEGRQEGSKVGEREEGRKERGRMDGWRRKDAK